MSEQESARELVKRACAELGVTQRELAERIGMGADSLNTAVSANKLSKIAESAILLVLENAELKRGLSDYEVLKNAIKTAIS
ncbi:MAG: transcriptional regulator [Wolinella sp.]